jgi:hypothetical protein
MLWQEFIEKPIHGESGKCGVDIGFYDGGETRNRTGIGGFAIRNPFTSIQMVKTI